MTAKAREVEMWAPPSEYGADSDHGAGTDGGILKIGDDCCGLGPNNFVIEGIGEQFTDDNGWLMVDVTLAERM